MSNFAKLFQVTPLNQVLLLISTNEANTICTLTQITVTQGVIYNIGVDYDNEDTASRTFDEYTQENAELYYRNCCDLLRSQSRDAEPFQN